MYTSMYNGCLQKSVFIIVILIISVIPHVHCTCAFELKYREFNCSIDEEQDWIHLQVRLTRASRLLAANRNSIKFLLQYKEVNRASLTPNLSPKDIAEFWNTSITSPPCSYTLNLQSSNLSYVELYVDCIAWSPRYLMYYPYYVMRILKVETQINDNINNDHNSNNKNNSSNSNGKNNISNNPNKNYNTKGNTSLPNNTVNPTKHRLQTTTTIAVWNETYPYQPQLQMCRCKNYYRFYDFNYTTGTRYDYERDTHAQFITLAWKVPSWLVAENYVYSLTVIKHEDTSTKGCITHQRTTNTDNSIQCRDPVILTERTFEQPCAPEECKYEMEDLRKKHFPQCQQVHICLKITVDNQSIQCLLYQNDDIDCSVPDEDPSSKSGLSVEVTATVSVTSFLAFTAFLIMVCTKLRGVQYPVEIVEPRDTMLSSRDSLAHEQTYTENFVIYTEILDCVVAMDTTITHEDTPNNNITSCFIDDDFEDATTNNNSSNNNASNTRSIATSLISSFENSSGSGYTPE